jgi:hypothetical protein
MAPTRAFVTLSLSLLSTFAIAPDARAQEHDAQPRVSIAVERVGGVSYLNAFDKNSSAATSLTVFGIGGVTVNPYSAPRLGIDAILDNGLTIGGGASIQRFSLSATDTNGRSQSIGSLFIYTLEPRVGYRIPVSPDFDITPRGGLTLAGGSISSAQDNSSAGLFALALSGEGVFAWRATRSFNLLAGLGADYTISATGSTTNSSGTSNSSQDIKGGLFALQLWLGIGGYL